MRNKFARKHLVSPASGDVISLNDLDEMNFHRVYGDGYALMPDSGIIYAPADGVIADISENMRKITVRTLDGVMIVVRIGYGSGLPSEHIIPYVCVGDRVDSGQLIAMIDMSALPPYERRSAMPVVITNVEKLKSYSVCGGGHLTGGKSIAMRYSL